MVPCYCLLEWVWGCMLTTYRSHRSLLLPVGWQRQQFFWGLVMACWSGFGAYSSFGALLWPVGVGLGLYDGTLQVFWFLVMACWSGFGAVSWHPTGLLVPCYCLLEWVCGCMLATYSSFGALLWPVGVGLGRTVPLGPCYGLLEWVWGCMLAPYRSSGSLLWPVGVAVGLYVGSYNSFGALFWPVGVGLGLYVGNLQFFWGFVMACWSGFGAVCRQPTVLLGPCYGLLGWVWGCMSATYSSFGALLWPVGVGLGLYVGNLQFFWGIVMACWSGFGAVCRQPTVLLGPCYGLLEYVGNLQVSSLLAIACAGFIHGFLLLPVGVGSGLLATYMFWARLSEFRAVGWQLAGLIGLSKEILDAWHQIFNLLRKLTGGPAILFQVFLNGDIGAPYNVGPPSYKLVYKPP